MSKPSLLPSSWYEATIAKASTSEWMNYPHLHLLFVIDRGQYLWRHLFKRYPLNSRGMDRLENNFKDMGFFVVTDYNSDLFTEQFTQVNMRASIQVDRMVDGDVVKNVIIQLAPAEHKPEIDAHRQKTDDHYYQEQRGRDLPINSQES